MHTIRRRHIHTTDLHAEHAQAMAEYALLLTLIFVVVAAAVPALGSSVNALYTSVAGLF